LNINGNYDPTLKKGREKEKEHINHLHLEVNETIKYLNKKFYISERIEIINFK